MTYGVKMNVRAVHRFLRLGSLCWVQNTNNGWGNDRFLVLGISRGGRRVETWVNARDVTNARAGWIPEESPAFPFDSREHADRFAAQVNARAPRRLPGSG